MRRSIGLVAALPAVGLRIGIPWREAQTIGNLLGTRTIVNEFPAFAELGKIKAD